MEKRDIRRKYKRYPAKWKSAVLLDKSRNKPVIHAQTQDLSVGGTALYSEHGDLEGSVVILLLAGPPVAGEIVPKMMRLRARVVSSVYSEPHSAYRLGLSFVKSDEGTITLLGQILESGEIAPLAVGPTVAAEPAPSAGMSRLERLKKMAQAKQDEPPEAQQDDSEQEVERRISGALERTYTYLSELVSNLNLLKPPFSKPYALAVPGAPGLDDLAWLEGSVEYRGTKVPSIGERFEFVSLYYTLGGKKPMRITREVPAHERLKQELQSLEIKFQMGEEKNERGSVVRVTFHFPSEVKAKMLLKADFSAGRIVLTTEHVERFGNLTYRLAPEAFTDEAIDELAGFILGETRTLGSLVQNAG